MKIFDILGRQVINIGEWLSGSGRRESLYRTSVIDGATHFNTYQQDKQKIAAVLSNPALLKVFSIQCDLFSLGEVKVMKNEKEIEEDPFLKLLDSPNPFQTKAQFLWDFMFWTMIGSYYCYIDSANVAKKNNVMYFLNPAQMEWPRSFEQDRDKLVFSPDTIKQRMQETVTYRYADNTSIKIPVDRILIGHDLTNGVGNWYKSPSRLDALYKVISNSEEALDSKNINLIYSGKFMVAGTQDPSNTSQLPLGDTETMDIEQKMNGGKRVYAMKSMIDIKRFVEDMKALQLNQAFMEDYYTMSLMYGIPRDVAEALAGGSTYENQEKARMAHITYGLSPKGNEFMNAFERKFGYHEQGKNITMTWDHLPLAQVFEESRSKVSQTNVATLKEMLALGVPIDEANEFLGTEFSIDETKKQQANGTAAGQGQQGGAQGSAEGQGQASEGNANGE